MSHTSITRILCPVDFSDFSRRALDEAVALAHLMDGCVTALHVFPIAIPGNPFAGLQDFEPFTLTDKHRAHLLRQLSDFATAEGAERNRITVALREGVDIHAEILTAAAEMEPDLIVLGTHGRSGFQRLMLGSVTEKVLHKSQWPVLTVPARAPDAVPAGPAPFKRILCGVDFSDCSQSALRYAVSLAEQARAHLDVLSVVLMIPMYDATGVTPLDYASLLERLKADVAQRLEAAVRQAGGGADVDRMVTAGDPHLDIVRVATERGADLIVLGAYSHSGFDHALFGSTTNQVVRRATCPVLTV